MKAAFALLTWAAVLLAAPTSAEPPPPKQPPWAIGVRSEYAYYGRTTRPTGGLKITVDAIRNWGFGESSAVSVGVAMSIVGMDAGARWVAILGGPTASVRTQTWGPVEVGLGAHLDFGRLPTCSALGLCFLYSGFFPAFSATVRYSPSDRVSLSLVGGARVIKTIGWEGVGGEGGLASSVRF